MKNLDRVKVMLAQNGTFGALAVLVVVFAIANPRFFSAANAQTVLSQIVELGLIALPLAFIVMSGAIDLSVGSIASLAGIVAGITMSTTGTIWLALLAALGVGAAAGAINGILIAVFRFNPMVVTLGFLSAWGGLALLLTNGHTLSGLPADLALIDASFGPVSVKVIVLIGAIVAAWLILERTAFGRRVLAVGGNPRAAGYMGISVASVRFRLYLATGMLAGVAGFMLVAKVKAASPTLGSGLEIQALTVVLLGGVAFEGGFGRISGVVAGLLFVGVLRNGLVILGVSQFLQTIIVGLTLVLAVALDRGIQRMVRQTWSSAVRRTRRAAPPQREASK